MPAQRAAYPYRHAEARLPCARELPSDVGRGPVIERRHDPQQPRDRRLIGGALPFGFRVGHIEEVGQRGLSQLHRNALVPHALRQTPGDISEHIRWGPIGKMQPRILPQLPQEG